MAKELLLYTGIYSFVAEELINSIEANMGSDITLRVNSGGGDVFPTYGIMAKMAEHGDVTVQVDGIAASSAANLLLFAKYVKAWDVSNFVLHRADAYVSSPEEQNFLDKVNKDLRAKLESKVSAEKFKEITGASIDQLFNPESRINLFLTAKQMKQIGIVNEINKLNPTEVKAFSEAFRVAAEHKPTLTPAITPTSTKTSTAMTLAEFKAAHPALFAEVVALGVAEEKDRVEACLVYMEVDPAGVKAAIESGKPLSQKQMAEFGLKVLAQGKLQQVVAGSPGPVETGAAPGTQTEKEKNVDEFANGVKASMAKLSGKAVGAPQVVDGVKATTLMVQK